MILDGAVLLAAAFAATILPLDKACIITDYLTDQSLSQKTIIKEVDKL